MNLLFIGGNRYFGKEVLNRLLKKNLNIYLVNRNTKRNYQTSKFNSYYM